MKRHLEPNKIQPNSLQHKESQHIRFNMENLYYDSQKDPILINVPAYLKAKSGKLYFTADRRKIKHPPIHIFSIDVIGKESALDIINILARNSHALVVDDGHVKTTILRSGSTPENAEGYEILVEQFSNITRNFLCRLDVVKKLDDFSKFSYAVFSNCEKIVNFHNPDLFYKSCTEIIQSISLPSA